MPRGTAVKDFYRSTGNAGMAACTQAAFSVPKLTKR